MAKWWERYPGIPNVVKVRLLHIINYLRVIHLYVFFKNILSCLIFFSSNQTLSSVQNVPDIIIGTVGIKI